MSNGLRQSMIGTALLNVNLEVFYSFMNYWLINPKNEGSNTDLTNESLDSVYMGWDANTCPKFYNEVQKNDIIIVTEGAHYNTKLHYIGIAEKLEDNCWTLKLSTDKKNEEISQIIRKSPEDFGGGSSKNPWGPTKSIIQLTENPAEKQIKQILNKFFMEKQTDEQVKRFVNLLNANKNLILTGSPGTGKTYLAKKIAQQMIFGEVKEHLTNEEQKQYDEQCGFVQFHPSYDYTDFVEGLRPIKTENELSFKRKDGIFKDFCKRASVTMETIKNQFDLLWQNIQDGNIEHIPLYTGQDSLRMIVDGKNHETIHFSKKDNPNDISEGNDVTLNDIYTIIIKKNINTTDALREAGPYRDSLGVGGNQNDKWAVCNYILERIHDKPYVFIIDEINRGEISKIFGELFYSIDPGYRGERGKVDTQYQNLIPKEGDNNFVSKEADAFRNGFYVPNNVYIIGTMNDIDRSVESMDFAMRRRFAFKEIKAEDRVVMLDDLQWKEDAVERMKKLNTAIEKIEGLSSAYHIGPAYFLKLKNYDGDFDQLWEHHIEGLLFEYMRGMTDVNANLKALANAYGYSKANNYDQSSNN